MNANDHPRPWLALSVCMSATFMSLLDVNMVNIALPTIEERLGASEADLQWIVAGYSLALGLMLIPAGRLGDLIGRRTIFVIGVSVFTIGSALAGLAPTPDTLIAARLFQGVGGGMLNPQVSGLIQDLFRGAARGRAFGMHGTVIAVSSAIGPVVGGVILGVADTPQGWRWIFFVNVPVGVVTAVLAARLMPKPVHLKTTVRDLDPIGTIFIGVTMLAVLYPLVLSGQGDRSHTWLFVLAAAVSVSLFALSQRFRVRRGLVPLIDVSLFRLPGYTSGVFVAFLFFVASTGFFFVVTLYLQIGIGQTPLVAGLTLLPIAIGSALTSAIGGSLVFRFGWRLVASGLILLLLGFLGTYFILATTVSSQIAFTLALPLLVIGLGNGLIVSPNQALSLADVPSANSGIAAALITTGQRMGASIGVAVSGSAYFAVLAKSDPYPGAILSAMVTVIAVTVAALGLTAATLWRQRH